MLSVLTKSLNLTQEQVCVMAALLGNFLLTENDLQDIYKKINIKSGLENVSLKYFINLLINILKLNFIVFRVLNRI